LNVMTVRGPVPSAELGVTLPHEHLFIDLLREYRGTGLLHDEALTIEEVRAFRAAGGSTIVDCTSEGLGRDPVGLRRVSEATGVQIVMGSGHYRRPYLDEVRLDRMSVDQIAAEIVRDLTNGVGDTGIRAGIIGEIGCDRHIGALEERVFRAAARAHRETGVTITTHAARWPVGEAQLDLLAEEGVDPGRVIVGHCDMVPDPAYHERLARRGAWVQFDTIQGVNEWDTQRRLGWIRSLFDAGLEGRLLLSHDVCLTTDLAAYGGPGYAYLLTGFREHFDAAGFPGSAWTTLMQINPRRALSGEP
jgi:predicted metal-dependent phosphotriesterase family hydrolase